MELNQYSHIHSKFREIAELSNEERINFLQKPRWIGYSHANETIKLMQSLMNRTKQHRMPNLLLIGESNNGKTTIIKKFVEQFGEPYVDEVGLNVPVRSIQAPPSASEKELYISLIESFALPYRHSDAAIKLRYQVIHALREAHVKLLIIDEAHSMLTGTARQQRQIMNCLKYLCNEIEIPIVLSGTKDAIRILHTDPQHASRFDVAELPMWKNDKNFTRLIGSFEMTMPLKQPSKLIEQQKLNMIHSISGGNIGNVKRLLTECAIDAIQDGSEVITLVDLKSKSFLKPTRGLRTIMS